MYEDKNSYTFGQELPNSNMLEKYQDVCEMLDMDSDCSHRELIEELEWAVKCARFVTWKGIYDEVEESFWNIPNNLKRSV
jgi:hypothetical protein